MVCYYYGIYNLEQQVLSADTSEKQRQAEQSVRSHLRCRRASENHPNMRLLKRLQSIQPVVDQGRLDPPECGVIVVFQQAQNQVISSSDTNDSKQDEAGDLHCD